MGSDKNHSVAKTLEPFVCGGAAATFASVIIHPIDLAKVRFHRDALDGIHELFYSLGNDVIDNFFLSTLSKGSNAIVWSTKSRQTCSVLCYYPYQFDKK